MLLESYIDVRQRSERICAPLKTEDYVVQPIVDVSPPKWHLGHSSWFFEQFILKPYQKGYQEFDANYNFVFNSYYETVGARVIRTNRGNLTRPSVDEVMGYRTHVDEAMRSLLHHADQLPQEIKELATLGLNHEEQHQELLLTDIKYILGHNPLFPPYYQNRSNGVLAYVQTSDKLTTERSVSIDEGLYQIGHNGQGFCFDNELSVHQVYIPSYSIHKQLVTNKEYLEFILDGGYQNFRFWHAEGWDWVKNNQIEAPLYWHKIDNVWQHYTFGGLQDINDSEPVCHVSYYEAAAYASWKGKRLPTEFEWETAADKINWGKRWEWTESAYLPYPNFKKLPGAIGEYNGKFMVNQMVLRGSSIATSPGHSRKTYRNFFHPYLRWQFTGIRLTN
ncbi:ergothioneine biosynthesis protein EgtB [Olivibacter sp. SDN3]|uniref:ergothioneine biosynthesis protein EgtB n=1 Tax=Olivibacter sp. SDN3 TaxID=2764720 RepID=UPI0016519C7A|nr:ergothioneine biosynthesis protein EgtB [Olivibacter sp. SDN3]QNL49667.1 ergothioneine biosynthesis protein EgtB [Olivibacter sp. SDN3]